MAVRWSRSKKDLLATKVAFDELSTPSGTLTAIALRTELKAERAFRMRRVTSAAFAGVPQAEPQPKEAAFQAGVLFSTD